MARFTHITREKDEPSVRRSGIKPTAVADGVHAMPVLPNFFVLHQWLRELRRLGSTPLVAVDFVIPDDEQVRVGHYSEPHAVMTAAEATGAIRRVEDPRGYEVVILRRIETHELKRTRHVPQVVGWRYWPDAHGERPCSCEVCRRGTYKAARLRRS